MEPFQHPRTRRIGWRSTGNAIRPYQATIDGARWTIQVNDFPAEPLYTLFIDDEEQESFNEWPQVWLRPA